MDFSKKIFVNLFAFLVCLRALSSYEYLFSSSIVFERLQQVSEFDLFTLDDIDSAFQSMTRLTYSQNYYMSGKFLFSFLLLVFRRSGNIILMRLENINSVSHNITSMTYSHNYYAGKNSGSSSSRVLSPTPFFRV